MSASRTLPVPPVEQLVAFDDYARAVRHLRDVQNVHAEARYYSSTPATVTSGLSDLEERACKAVTETLTRLRTLILEAKS